MPSSPLDLNRHILRAFVGSRRVSQTEFRKFSLSFLSLFFSRSSSECADSFFLYFLFLFVFDFVQTGVAALRSGRNKGNVRYANDEEGFGGAALSNTTLASEDEEEDEDDEDEDEEEEEDSESEGEEDGDDEEEDSGSENKRAKKKQRFAASNRENNKKRKRTLARSAKEIESEVKKISAEDLEKAKAEAINLNFTVGSGAYVALVVLLAGKAVGHTGHESRHNCGVCASVGFRRENEEREEDEHGSFYDSDAMKADNSNFVRKRDRTYSLADKLEKLEKRQ